MNSPDLSSSDLSWFQDARFGMFIHWGLYALPGGIWRGQEAEYVGEWLQARFRIRHAEYARLSEDFLAPDFDAEAWVRSAREAGMRYVVFTAKHHDGFAMYHSRVSPFNIVEATPFARDPLAELAQACRAQGLRLGIYYSQDLDWSHPDGGDPGPDFYTNKGMPWGNCWDFPDLASKRFERYFEQKALPQVEELLTRYGDIALLWFDCPVSIPPALSQRLVARVKELQPRCLVNSRVGHGLGDYGSLGDNQTPAARRAGAWECPGTLNDSWGFKWTDHAWKSPAEIIGLLITCAARDSNYLLNVGPRPDGSLPAPTTRILDAVGDWMRLHGSAIHGTTGNPFPTDFDWGWMTLRVGRDGAPSRLHLILKPEVTSSVMLNGLGDRVRRVFDLVNPAVGLPFQHTALAQGGALSIQLGDGRSQSPSNIRETETLPRVVVVELATSGEPAIDARFMPQNGALRLQAARATVRTGSAAAASGERLVGVGAAGELAFGGGTAALKDGLWLDGHLGEAALVWRAWLPEPGEFQVDISSVSREHGASWCDGQTVRVQIGFGAERAAQVLQTRLQGTLSPAADATCFAEGHAPVGRVTISHPSEIEVVFRVLDPGGQDRHHIGFKELSFRRVAGGS